MPKSLAVVLAMMASNSKPPDLKYQPPSIATAGVEQHWYVFGGADGHPLLAPSCPPGWTATSATGAYRGIEGERHAQRG